MRSLTIAACLLVAACNVKDARWYGYGDARLLR